MHNKENTLARFLRFLTTDDLYFRKAVFRSPLVAAICTFILNWLIFSRSSAESLLYSAFVFLLACFVGLIWEMFSRRIPSRNK
jgi:hypothetical protein